MAVRVSNVAVVRAAVPPRATGSGASRSPCSSPALVGLGFAAGRPTAHVTVAAQRDVGAAGHRRLPLDVLDRRRPEPPRRRPGRGPHVHPQPGRRHAHRDRRLRRVRRARRAADDRHRPADRCDRQAHDVARHGDRDGDPRLDRRHRRVQPAPSRPTGVDLGDRRHRRATPAGRHRRRRTGDFQPDTIVVLTDGANTEGVEPLVAAEQAAAAAGAGLRHRLRHDRAVAAGVQHRPARRRPRRHGRFDPGPPGGGGRAAGGRRFLQIDEATLQARRRR